MSQGTANAERPLGIGRDSAYMDLVGGKIISPEEFRSLESPASEKEEMATKAWNLLTESAHLLNPNTCVWLFDIYLWIRVRQQEMTFAGIARQKEMMLVLIMREFVEIFGNGGVGTNAEGGVKRNVFARKHLCFVADHPEFPPAIVFFEPIFSNTNVSERHLFAAAFARRLQAIDRDPHYSSLLMTLPIMVKLIGQYGAETPNADAKNERLARFSRQCADLVADHLREWMTVGVESTAIPGISSMVAAMATSIEIAMALDEQISAPTQNSGRASNPSNSTPRPR